MLMQVNFEAAGWWYVIEPGEGEEINYPHDCLALAAILRSVPADMLSSLHDMRTSAASAGEAIKRFRVRVQHVHEANAQQLRRDFGALVWKEAENAEDFANRITGLTTDLRLLSDNIIDVEVVQKMLQVVPEHLSQVAISIETLLDINNISVEEVTSMLRAVEQRRKPAPVLNNKGRLLLCEEEWTTKLKLRESEGKGEGSNSDSGNGKKCGVCSRGGGRGNGDDSASSSREGKKAEFGGGSAPKQDQCKRCGKYGHWGKDYRSKPKAEAHVAQAKEDNEPVLLMARASVFSKSPSPPRVEGFQIFTKRQPLRVVEEKVFVQL
jgi:hypothetical protein